MGTVSKDIADRVIAGEFPEDNVVKIVVYQNAFNGQDAYGLITKGDDLNRYHASQYVRNPRVYWEAK